MDINILQEQEIILIKYMKETPIKIIYKKQKSKRCPCNNIGYGVIGNKKTGEIIQTIKFNHKTGEKEIIFENKKEMKIMMEKI